MTLTLKQIDVLTDEVLTFIEQREAEQIAYGIYDITMTGADVLEGFRPVGVSIPPNEDRLDAIRTAMLMLSNRLDLLRFDEHSDNAIEEWVFRSRIAEIVRLISLLRQRLVLNENMRAAHRLSSAKRLVADVTLTVMSRLVPSRNLPARGLLENVLSQGADRQRVADLLLNVIEQSLPKLREMSGFQKRALEAIFRAVELEEAGSSERGVVVTASTGAGKTYAFFLPILAKALLERCLRNRVGVKAICIYPRVALSENQLGDFIEVLFHINQALERAGLPQLTIGIESGATVYEMREFNLRSIEERKGFARRRGWIYQEQDHGFLSPFAYCIGVAGYECVDIEQRLIFRPAGPKMLICPRCGTQYPFIMFTRHGVMDRHPPDILVATTESLNKRLTGARYQYLFGTDRFCAPSVVMLDEIHLQTSTAGTQVALLLRRLIARIRVGKAERRERDNLAFVGLSATIARPVQFVAELTGIQAERIKEVRPYDDEMEVIGAERFIFVRSSDSEDTARISTLIQATMCVLHTMPQPTSESGLERYRSFGFVQSLDIVGRWLYQMKDAERDRDEQRRNIERVIHEGLPVRNLRIQDVPLYMYRFPPHNRNLFPQLLGASTRINCRCDADRGPNRSCPLFQAGECWWVLSQDGRTRQEPIVIKRKSASDRASAIEMGDDLIITTSALEVGYDDDALMCVIQYGAPSNIASFVQRKGRGGRKVGTRPIVVTVLSPYSASEIFLYRNQHLLTDPTFRKLPLNAHNRFLQHIHGFYAVMDWMARAAEHVGVDLDLEGLNGPALTLLQRLGEDSATLLALKDYVAQAFSLDSSEASRLMGDADGVLLDHFLELLRRVSKKLENEPTPYGEDGRDLLRDKLPENLFSDINLPEVRVNYRQNDRGISESISLALFSTMPGNVTFRGGVGSAWVPPIISLADEVPRIVVQEHYRGEKLPQAAKVNVLPQRALRLAGIDSNQIRELIIYRPDDITPRPFSRDHNSAYWYCNPDTGTLTYHENWQDAGQHERQLAHSSKGFPITAVEIRADSEEIPPAFRLTPGHPSLCCDVLGEHLARQIILYNDEPANRNLLDVRLMVLGSQYMVNFHWQRAEPIEGTVGFTADEYSEAPCALGYQMTTEGLALDLATPSFDRIHLGNSLLALLRYTAARHAFVTELTVEHGRNIFAAANLADALLTIADLHCAEEEGSPTNLSTWMLADTNAFQQRLSHVLRKVYHLSEKKAVAAEALAEDETLVRAFAHIYADVAGGGSIFQDYLQDTFTYSISQALKQTAQEIAGVEALRYIGAWARLRVDYGPRTSDRIWLYEIGMGGIGVMRATHTALQQEPDRFWSKLAHKMTRCATAQEETLLRHVLAQPEEWLSICDALAQTVRSARGSIARQEAIEALLAEVRRRLGVIIRQEQVKALLRVFIPEYVEQVRDAPLVNWQLYREINQLFLPACSGRLGRSPTFDEARGLLYLEIASGATYPELSRLLALYRDEHGPGAADEARQAFENAVERRLLISCYCSCPSCLNDRGGQEGPGTGWMLLSRPLLAAWLDHVRADQTLTLDRDLGALSVTGQLRELLEGGARVIYLRAPSSLLSDLCATVSYLTDAGIDTAAGMIYPMITNVQTIFADEVGAQPLVELTIRPIV